MYLDSFTLGDRSKVMMFVHASPHEEDVGETSCSFSFAKRARAVECIRELSIVCVSNILVTISLFLVQMTTEHNLSLVHFTQELKRQ